LAVKVVVGKKGYIIIPKSIRELVGIKEGDVLTLTVENGRIVLEPERKASLPEVAKRLREHEERVRGGDIRGLGAALEVNASTLPRTALRRDLP